MQGYLLDNNHVSAYFSQEPSVIAKVDSMSPEHFLWVSAITLGEIEAGHRMTTSTDQVRRDEFTKFVHDKFYHHRIEVSEHTGRYYGKIIGRIFANNPPQGKFVTTEKWLVSMGIDVNDVWTVAVAWERKLVFATSDEMRKIRDVVENNPVRFTNWRLVGPQDS